MDKDPNERQRSFNRQLLGLGRRDASAGLTFGVSIVVFTLLGWWLDDWLHTSPMCLLAGAALGAVGGFIHLVEAVSPGTLFGRRKPKDDPPR